MVNLSLSDFMAYEAKIKASKPAAHSDGVKKESDLHESIIQFCRDRGWQYLHGAMSERTHRTAGEPDFILLAPAGVVLLVECKSKSGKLSPAQLAFQAHALKNGHTIHVVRSMSEFLVVVKKSHDIIPKSV